MYKTTLYTLFETSLKTTETMSRLFWTVFQPYYLDVFKTYSILKTSDNYSKSVHFKKIKRLYCFHYLLLICYFFRFLVAGWDLSCVGDERENTTRLIKYDLTFDFALQLSGLKKPTLLYVTSPLPLFAFSFHFVVYYRLDRLIWSQLYYVLVVNSKKYIAKYFESKKVWQGSFPSTVKCSFKVLLKVNWQYFWKRKQLPNDDVLALANIQLYYQAIFYASCGVASFLFFYPLFDKLPPKAPLEVLFIFIDLLFIWISALYSLKGAIFVTLIGGLFPQIAISEYWTLNSFLEKNNNRNTLKPTTNKTHLQRSMRLLAAFRQRHTTNTHFLLHYNRHIVSDCCAAYFLFNLPFNVYVLLYLLYHPADKIYLFLLATFAMQTFVPVISIFNFIATNEAIISSVPHLRATFLSMSQAKNTQRCLFTESWKTASYIELLHRSTGRLELSAGQLGAFTRENVLKFVTVYAAFIMYFYGNFII